MREVRASNALPGERCAECGAPFQAGALIARVGDSPRCPTANCTADIDDRLTGYVDTDAIGVVHPS